MFYVLAITSLLLQGVLTSSSAAVWFPESSIQTSSHAVVTTSQTTNSGPYSLTYSSAFNSAPSVALGILAMDFPDNQASLGWSLSNIIPTSSSVSVSLQITSGSVDLLTVSLMAIESTQTAFTTGYIQNISPSGISSGSGARAYEAYRPFSSAANLTHKVFVVPYLSGTTLTKSATQAYIFRIVTEVKDSGNWNYSASTEGTTLVSKFSFYYLIFDQTAIQASKVNYIDAIFPVSLSQPAAISLVSSDPTNFHAGINSYHFADSQRLNFNFSTGDFSLTTSSNSYQMNFSIVNYRYRVCIQPDVYFLESDNLCYDQCLDGSHPNGNIYSCDPCQTSCATCSSQSGCTSCDTATNFRELDGITCVCQAGYYDAGTSVVCEACSILSVGCLLCTSSACTQCDQPNGYIVVADRCATVCETYQTGCLTCASATTCSVCKPGWTRAGVGCVLCASITANCTDCSSATICTSCAPGTRLQGSLCVVLCDGSLLNCLSCSSAFVCASCAFGYVLQGPACKTCGQLMGGCINCSSNNVCSQCSAGYTLSADNSRCLTTENQNTGTPSGNNNTNNDNMSQTAVLSTLAVAGIAVAAASLACCLGMWLFVCWRRRKSRVQQEKQQVHHEHSIAHDQDVKKSQSTNHKLPPGTLQTVMHTEQSFVEVIRI